MSGGLLITRRAVDLARTVKPGEGAQFKRRPQSARVEMIVFDRIASDCHFDLLKPGHRPQHRQLDVGRQRRADPVGIDQMAVEPFGFEENLVPVTIGKAVNLVLDRRTIARARRPDRTGKHR